MSEITEEQAIELCKLLDVTITQGNFCAELWKSHTPKFKAGRWLVEHRHDYTYGFSVGVTIRTEKPIEKRIWSKHSLTNGVTDNSKSSCG